MINEVRGIVKSSASSEQGLRIRHSESIYFEQGVNVKDKEEVLNAHGERGTPQENDHRVSGYFAFVRELDNLAGHRHHLKHLGVERFQIRQMGL